MYRGAWAEWEMDHIEMAVPISPEELRFKRNAILKHQSQAESAPYLACAIFLKKRGLLP
jgi:glucosamine-6-phosphate deaminase